MSQIITDFQTLFQGNRTALGTEEGGCYRLDGLDDVWEEYVEWHLTGEAQPIGVYPMVARPRIDNEPTGGMSVLSWQVHWGCIDWDIGEDKSLAHAWEVQNVFTALGVTSWVERSRSKGYHLWVFASEWAPAVTMRKALLAACQVVDAPVKEVNPKQVTLKPGQLGNYVRLPYPGAYGRPVPDRDARRVVLDQARNVYPVGEFAAEAMAARVGVDALQAIGDTFYVEPPRPVVQYAEPAELDGDAQSRMSGLAFSIYTNGPLEGSGRAHTLYKLMRVLAEDGNHTLDEIRTILHNADQAWGKFTEEGRPEQIDKMIEENL